MSDILKDSNSGDLELIMKSLEASARAISGINELLPSIVDENKRCRRDINTMIERVDSIEKSWDDRFSDMEQSQEITEDMYKEIQSVIRRRIAEILDFDSALMGKYYGGFAKKFYSEARKHTSCANSMRRTKKRDYQSVISYAESWYPRCGAPALKREIDDRALLRRKAREEGYEQ